jgi:hypothetical protein
VISSSEQTDSSDEDLPESTSFCLGLLALSLVTGMDLRLESFPSRAAMKEFRGFPILVIVGLLLAWWHGTGRFLDVSNMCVKI